MDSRIPAIADHTDTRRVIVGLLGCNPRQYFGGECNFISGEILGYVANFIGYIAYCASQLVNNGVNVWVGHCADLSPM